MKVEEATAKLVLVLDPTYEFGDYDSMVSYSFPQYELKIQSE